MIKKILLSVLLLFVVNVSSVSALGGIKLVELGLKAGITTETVKILGPAYGNYALSTDPRTGFQIGIVSRINLPLLHIQPELLYTMSGYSLMAHSVDGTLTKSKVKYNTFDVPVLVGLRLLMFRINVGPVFNLVTNTNVSKSDTPAHSVIMTKAALGYAIGLGADIGKVNLDVRYNGNFARPEQNIQIGSQTGQVFNSKMRSWAFSVGYLF